MLTFDIHEGSTAHIRLTGTTIDLIQVASIYRDVGIATCFTNITTTIDVTAYGYLGLHRGCDQEQYYADYGDFNFQLYTLNYKLSIPTTDDFHRRIIQIWLTEHI